MDVLSTPKQRTYKFTPQVITLLVFTSVSFGAFSVILGYAVYRLFHG